MTHDEIRARLAEIENILFAPSAYRNNYILGQPSRRDHEAFAAHIQEQIDDGTQREKLIAERTELYAMLPKTGEASGQRMVIGRTLGTTILRAEDLDAPPPEPEYNDDPWERGDREMGIVRYSK